jgi:hypothetical protein
MVNGTSNIQRVRPSTPKSQSPIEIANANFKFSEYYPNLPKVQPSSARSGNLKTPMDPTVLDAFEAVSLFVGTEETAKKFEGKLSEMLSRDTAQPRSYLLPTEPSVRDITVQRDLAIIRRDTAGCDAITAVSHASVKLEDLNDSDQEAMKGGLASLQSWARMTGRQD